MKLGSACLLLFASAACSKPAVVPTAEPSTPKPPTVTAQQRFDEGLAAFVAHDRDNDWSRAACAEVAGIFDDAVAKQNGPFVQATFDAGLAWQRCGDDAKAREHFEKAAKDDPKFDPAQARLALYRFRGGSADSAIEALTNAVVTGEFKNVAALVDLATMQMARDADKPGTGCKNDLDCAKLNLQRALAIDDAYMPALNQLGLYYLQFAKKSSKKADVQQLELAALVCQQAIAKNDSYAPIHNTNGLVQHALGRESVAATEFARAAALDPRFYEAHMNQAALNLGFRGFEHAEQAYRKALAVRPNDYDAHLGLALALRGPMSGSEPDYAKRVAAVAQELATAKKIDPERPDAYFNEGILTQEFEARPGSSVTEQLGALDRAQGSFERFLEKAKDKPSYAPAVEKAKERLKDIDVARDFIKKK